MLDLKKNYIQFDNKSNGIANSLMLMSCSILLLPVLFTLTSELNLKVKFKTIINIII